MADPEPVPPVAARWVGVWTASPQPAAPADLPPEPFTRDGVVLPGDTLRQTIRLSADARRIRLRLSNVFGGSDLSVGRLCVALPGADRVRGADRVGGGRAGVSSVEAGTATAVTFAGRPGVVVPAGAEAVSDPVDFPVTAAANVTVSLWLPTGQSAGVGITTHAGSRTTSFVAPGDQAGDTDLTGAAEVDHWYFLSGVDACAGPVPGASVIPGASAVPGPAAAAVFLGDSLTDGRGSTTNGNDRWPDQLLDRMRSDGNANGVALLNQGIGGNRVLRDGLGPSITGRLDRDVLAVPGVRWLVLFAGVNDIGTADATQAAQRQVTAELCAAYERIAARAHAAGIAVFGATLTPFGGADPYDDPDGHREAARQAVNAWIRVSGHYDAVLDFDEAARDPQAHRQLLPLFDTGDHLHLNPAGYGALANAVPAGLFELPVSCL